MLSRGEGKISGGGGGGEKGEDNKRRATAREESTSSPKGHFNSAHTITLLFGFSLVI